MTGTATPSVTSGPLDRLTTDLDALDWTHIASDLEAYGCSVIKAVMAAEDCRDVAAWYVDHTLFRSRVVMGRHGFGRGEYQYFAYPLPGLISSLREAFYPHLARIANGWNDQLQDPVRFPACLADYLTRCHAAGQTRPTPLLLAYGEDDYNCLHQDLYGQHVFPLQIAILLSAPGREFTGGEFVVTEQRPRMQSRVEVLPLQQGDAAVFAVCQRPVRGTRGYRKVNLRHGVSRVRSGTRQTLGIIFHDAA
jgi:hypothetical protein